MCCNMLLVIHSIRLRYTELVLLDCCSLWSLVLDSTNPKYVAVSSHYCLVTAKLISPKRLVFRICLHFNRGVYRLICYRYFMFQLIILGMSISFSGQNVRRMSYLGRHSLIYVLLRRFHVRKRA